MSAISNVVSHYRKLCDVQKKIEVPEWDMQIYCKPFTLEQEEDIERRAQGNNHRRAIEILIMGALDKEGKKIFALEDKPKLLKYASARVVTRVAIEISGDSELSVDEMTEDALKN